jgi:hypothetical protein
MSEGYDGEWVVLSSRFRLGRGTGRELSRQIGLLLAGFEPTLAGSPGGDGSLRVTVEGHPGEPGWAVFTRGDGRIERRPLQRVGAAAVEHAIISRAVEGERHNVVLHAAAVQHSGGAALLLGDSGAGKTTLSLLLRHAGLHLLSDDISPMDPATAEVLPFPRSIHLDGAYPAEVRESLPPLPRGLPPERVPFPPPTAARASEKDSRRTAAPAPVAVRHIVVLGRATPGESRTEPLQSAEAVQHLLRSVIRGEKRDLATVLPALFRLAGTARAHRLLTSGPLEARDAALALLRTPGEGAPPSPSLS